MKLTITEYNDDFTFDLTPETMAEAALLVRLGMNAIKTVKYVSTNANQDGAIYGSVAIAKSKRPVSQVGRGKW